MNTFEVVTFLRVCFLFFLSSFLRLSWTALLLAGELMGFFLVLGGESCFCFGDPGGERVW